MQPGIIPANRKPANDNAPQSADRPTARQLQWLKRGLSQPGGKLPLFDNVGRQVNERTVRSCIEKGWAEHWFSNPIRPDWLVCKITNAGKAAIQS